MGTKPYLCPVCKGKTVVKEGFYPDDPERTSCRACYNGVVFGTSDDFTWVPNYIPPTTSPYIPPTPVCLVCGSFYSGSHNCLGRSWSGYSGPTIILSGSNPPTVSEVGVWKGEDYLNPGTISEDE